MIYAEFLNGLLRPIMGSDGILPLDGRMTRAHQIEDAKTRARQMNHYLNKGIRAIQIKKGTILQAVSLTPIIILEEHNHGR